MLVSEIISITFKISHTVVTCLHKALLGIMSKKMKKGSTGLAKNGLFLRIGTLQWLMEEKHVICQKYQNFV